MRAVIAACLVLSFGTAVADDALFEDPPPLAATAGIAGCPPPPARHMSPEDARREAHQRVERGTSCWLAGRCPPGGDYKGDDVVNARVAAAIAADPRFRDSTVWVETLRKFVTLKGCIRAAADGRALEALARSVDGVKLVWMEVKVVPRR